MTVFYWNTSVNSMLEQTSIMPPSLHHHSEIISMIASSFCELSSIVLSIFSAFSSTFGFLVFRRTFLGRSVSCVRLWAWKLTNNTNLASKEGSFFRPSTTIVRNWFFHELTTKWWSRLNFFPHSLHSYRNTSECMVFLCVFKMCGDLNDCGHSSQWKLRSSKCEYRW